MSTHNLNNEPLLVAEMQAGNEKAFAILYNHYSPQLYINIFKLVKDTSLAEEMVQELFTRVWQNRQSKGITENFSGYIYRIAQNLVHDFFRKLKRDHEMAQEFRLMAEENCDNAEEALQHQQTSAIFKKAIEQLTPQQKKVYELIKIEGFAYKKTAEIMGISVFTVKEYLVAANKSIRSYVLNNSDKT